MADNDDSTAASNTSSEPKVEESILDYIHDSDSSSRLARAQTLVPSDSASQTSSSASTIIPAAPTNTPATRSLVDATNLTNQLDELTLAAAHIILSQLPNAVAPARPSPATSETSIDEGKAHLRGPFRSELDIHKQLFKAPPPRSPRPPKRKKFKTKLIAHLPRTEFSSTGTRADGGISPPNEHVHESNTWVQYAKEDMDRGLKRLRQAAEDVWRTNRCKSIKQRYSEMLAEVIKNQEIEFDASYLH